MLHKLYERRKGADRFVRGLSCDESGLYFGGDCPLVTPSLADGRLSYRAQPVDEINRVLSAGYDIEFDVSAYAGTLERVARLMTDGDLASAQITALQMGLPQWRQWWFWQDK